MMPTSLDDPPAMVRGRCFRRAVVAIPRRDALPSDGTGGPIVAVAPPALPHFHGP